MTPRKIALTATVALLLASGGVLAFAADVPAPTAQPAMIAPGATATAAVPDTYLPTPLDTTHVLQPAPIAGTTRYEADRTTFLATRSLKDSDRWVLAQGDADSSKVLEQFSCSVGVTMGPATTPKLVAILLRMRHDASASTNLSKGVYKRKRPYLIDEGPICVDKTDSLAASPDYPSGHTTWGWSVGLILAELAPDRASQILLRARSIGESRAVCGVHNLSAIEAGRTNGSALVAALHGQQQFRDDLDKARKEMAKLRKSGATPDATACAAQAAILAKDPL